MEQMRDTSRAKNRLEMLCLYFAARIRTLLQTRVANFRSNLAVSAIVALFRIIFPFSMYSDSKNENKIHASGLSARNDLGIPLRRNVK